MGEWEEGGKGVVRIRVRGSIVLFADDPAGRDLARSVVKSGSAGLSFSHRLSLCCPSCRITRCVQVLSYTSATTVANGLVISAATAVARAAEACVCKLYVDQLRGENECLAVCT